MIIQFPVVYVDKLMSTLPKNKSEILRAIFLHSHDEEESEELEFCEFIMEADLTTLDDTQQYRVHENNTNH